MADLYAELRVPRDATAAEIKAAKKRRAKETHPDHGGDPEAFDRVTKAALVLLDPEKRAHYDRTGETEQRTTPLLEAAAGLMRQIMEMALEQFDPASTDVIGRAIEGLEESKKVREQDLAKLERDLAKAERNRSRLRHKNAERADLLGNMMDERIDDLRLQLSECGRAIEAHQLALDLLADYEWRHDPISSTVFSGTISSTSAWT